MTLRNKEGKGIARIETINSSAPEDTLMHLNKDDFVENHSTCDLLCVSNEHLRGDGPNSVLNIEEYLHMNQWQVI